MGPPAAKQGDTIVAVDIHIILVPSPGGPVPTPLPHPFNGILDTGLSTSVMINGMAAAVVGSTADNTPPHIPEGGSFSAPPTNKGIIIKGSSSVLIQGQPAARAGDLATTCNDVGVIGGGTVVAVGTVSIGG